VAAAATASVLTVLGVLALSATPHVASSPQHETAADPSGAEVASQLAAQADRVDRRDALTQLRLRLAAYAVDPTNAARRAALTAMLLGARAVDVVPAGVGPVAALAFDGSGRLAVGGAGGVRQLHGDVGALTASDAPVDAVAGVSTLAYGAGQLLAGGSSGLTVMLGSAGPTATSPADPVSVHALAPLGPLGWAATTTDGHLAIWDNSPPVGTSRVLATGLGAGSPLAASLDGQYVYVPARTGVDVIAVRTATTVAVVAANEAVTALAVGGGGHLLLVGHGAAATVWDVTDVSHPKRVADIAQPGGAIRSVAVANDGHTAVVCAVAATTVWELPGAGSPVQLAQLPDVTGPVTYRSDSAIIATGSGDVVHTWSVAELRLFRPAATAATMTLSGRADLAEKITVAQTNTDGSYLVLGGASQPATVWATQIVGIAGLRLDRASTLNTPIGGAAAAGDVSKTTVITYGSAGDAQALLLASPEVVFTNGSLGPATLAAVRPDGQAAVVISGTDATVWDLSFTPKPVASLTYPANPTAAAFAPHASTLIVGHSDGSATVDTLASDNSSAAQTRLAGSITSAVNAVALTDTGRAAALLDDGTLTVWPVTGSDTRAQASVAGAAAAGPHRLWLSPTGDFAILADQHRSVLWSLTDPSHPIRLATLLSANTAVPVLTSGDGSVAVQIGSDNTVTLWDLRPVLTVVADPTSRACALADLGNQTWRTIVAYPEFRGPCAPPPLPVLNSDAASGSPPPTTLEPTPSG
jgi:WD40 repeat protein